MFAPRPKCFSKKGKQGVKKQNETKEKTVRRWVEWISHGRREREDMEMEGNEQEKALMAFKATVSVYIGREWG